MQLRFFSLQPITNSSSSGRELALLLKDSNATPDDQGYVRNSSDIFKRTLTLLVVLVPMKNFFPVISTNLYGQNS